MSEILSLPAPKTKKASRKSFLIMGALLSGLFVAGSILLWQRDQEIVANITLPEGNSGSLQDSSRLSQTLDSRNLVQVDVVMSGKKIKSVPLEELGLFWSAEPSQSTVSAFFDSLTAQAGNDSLKGSAPQEEHLQLARDRSQWESFLQDIQQEVGYEPTEAELTWREGIGWQYVAPRDGRALNTVRTERSWQKLIADLQAGETQPALRLSTKRIQPEIKVLTEQEELAKIQEQIQKLTEQPLELHIGTETAYLDLKSREDFLHIDGDSVTINTDAVKEWTVSFAQQYSRPTNVVSIVGKEEERPGVWRAVTQGEFAEGIRIDADEVFQQITDALAKHEKSLTVKSYEIPVKIYSELEQTDYQLLSVGYSEYSKGNASNRVHNIRTGLERINGTLIDRNQEISFNKSVGKIDGDFRTGWGIFGTTALPVLGGGICQVSTTFYRALLNLGVPITMRQNHSWDLNYYQAGGYGLDATVFPERGLDVKAMNDIDSQLFIYSYDRPETQEAFVLIYGKGDGRKVTLEPHEDYVPFKGGKTLKWKQVIEMPDGQMKENEIVSRYRA